MVNQDSSSNPSSSNVHQFFHPHQAQLENQNFSPFHQSHGDFPRTRIQSLSPQNQDGHFRHFANILEPLNETNYQTQRLLSLSLGSQKSFNSSSQSHLSSSEQSPFYYHGAYDFTIRNSKYLKPVQSLLEEMANGGGTSFDSMNDYYIRRLSPTYKDGSLRLGSDLKAEFLNTGSLAGEKHDLQAKLVNLIGLLEEVEIRFEHYYNNLDEIVSSFEVITGLGSGKSYTTLALQAMSRHFCSLRESVVSQIYATRRNLLRENRNSLSSLQQLGIIRTPRQAWRPIRGLPESSVSILRSWLFEHFLNPYPNDIEKLMLASQTGLSKNQVSNWFINARVRLWKPMIEEMYKEEFAESEDESVNREGIIIRDDEED